MRSVSFGLRPLCASALAPAARAQALSQPDDRWLQSWQPALIWLASCNSIQTRRAYTSALRALMQECRAVPMGEIDSITVAMFKMAMVDKGLAPRTIRQRLAIAGALFAWAIDRGYHPGPNPVSPIPFPRVGRDLVGVALSGDQVEQLVAAAGNSRDRAILVLLADSGLRASELAALQERDLVLQRDPDSGGVQAATVTVRRGKGGYPRVVDLSAAAAGVLIQYLVADHRRAGATKPLFQHIDGSGLAISYHTVYRTVLAAAAAAGLGHLAPHDLRRTYCTLALDGGQPVPDVQRQMGHHNMNQTFAYYRARGQRP